MRKTSAAHWSRQRGHCSYTETNFEDNVCPHTATTGQLKPSFQALDFSLEGGVKHKPLFNVSSFFVHSKLWTVVSMHHCAGQCNHVYVCSGSSSAHTSWKLLHHENVPCAATWKSLENPSDICPVFDLNFSRMILKSSWSVYKTTGSLTQWVIRCQCMQAVADLHHSG